MIYSVADSISYSSGYNQKRNTTNVVRKENISVQQKMEISKERLSFYEQNRNNTDTLLNELNFYEGAVSADKGKEGYFSFGSDGHGQIIPKNAIPRINVVSLGRLYAVNNVLQLCSRNYYSYTGIDGNDYVCAFNGKTITRAFSEAILGDDKNNVAPECRGNTSLAMSIISSLIQGSVGGLHMLERCTVRESLAHVGIQPGKFDVEVDGTSKTYYLGENGSIYTQKRALDIVNMYNSNIWLKGRSVGDKIMVFGQEYAIDETGHIHVPEEGFWVNEKCDYGKNIDSKVE